MGKSYKDKANYYRFKDRLDEAPDNVVKKAKIMDQKYKGYRHGVNRKSNAKSKKLERRARRRKELPYGNVVDVYKEYPHIPNTHGMK